MSSRQLVARLGREHRLAVAMGEEAIQHAARCGEMLSRQKEHFTQAQIERWLEENCPFWHRVAELYLRA